MKSESATPHHASNSRADSPSDTLRPGTLKIAFYSTYILEYGGGFEKYLVETAAKLADMPSVEATVITMDDAFMTKVNDAQSRIMRQKIDHSINYKESLSDITKRLGRARYEKVKSFKELRQKLQNYDVIYSKNELREAFLLKYFVGYKNIPPVIFGGHTPLQYPRPKALPAKLRNALYKGPAYKHLASGVQKFHAINSYESGLYQSLFPGKTVVKVYNPFDIERFKKTASLHDYSLGSDPKSINIMWVGRLTEQKGTDDLAEIIRQVNAALPEDVTVTWNIFGDGDQRELITQLAREHKNVRYHGHVDQKKMANIYSKNHVFLSTSKWEGYPYTLIEMQAFGLQGFAYDIPGPSDIFAEYEGGHIARNLDEMAELLTKHLTKYKTADGVPASKPSAQFEPETIYKQLHAMLRPENQEK